LLKKVRESIGENFEAIARYSNIDHTVVGKPKAAFIDKIMKNFDVEIGTD